jgi:hypothetical protein
VVLWIFSPIFPVRPLAGGIHLIRGGGPTLRESFENRRFSCSQKSLIQDDTEVRDPDRVIVTSNVKDFRTLPSRSQSEGKQPLMSSNVPLGLGSLRWALQDYEPRRDGRSLRSRCVSPRSNPSRYTCHCSRAFTGQVGAAGSRSSIERSPLQGMRRSNSGV